MSRSEYEAGKARRRANLQRNLGYAMVTFSHADEARQAVLLTGGKLALDGKIVEIKKKGSLDHKDLDSVCSSEVAKKLILDSMNELATANKFNGLERVKKVHLHSEEFSIEGGLLTPSMKVKRNIAAKQFRGAIDALYNP
mgnify:CR=1 FL=1